MSLLALPFPRIDPVLFEFGPIVIRWYALSYIGGVLFAWWYCRRLVSNSDLWRRGIPATMPDNIDDLVLWGTIGVVLGGRLGYVVFYNPAYFMRNPADVFAMWQGGMSFHGGLAGVVLASVGYALRHRISMLSILDLVAASGPVGLGLGRLANFINGELYGRVSDVPWAMVFPGGGPDPRHPSQLYEAMLEGLVLFMFLRYLTHRRKALKTPGVTGAFFLMGYGVFRIIAELFRMPDAHIGFLASGLTMGMLLSLPMIVAGAILFVVVRYGGNWRTGGHAR